MQYFKDPAANNMEYHFEDHVQATLSNGVWSFKDIVGNPLKNIPTTLVPAEPPAPSPPSLKDQAVAAIQAGVAVQCASDSSLNATYNAGSAYLQILHAQLLFVSTFNRFPGSHGMIHVLDKSNNLHEITNIAVFKELVTALIDYNADLNLIINGVNNTLPTPVININ